MSLDLHPAAFIYIEKRLLEPEDDDEEIGPITLTEAERRAQERAQALLQCNSGSLPSFKFASPTKADPGATYFEATLEYATTEDGGVDMLRCSLYNLSPDIVRQFQADAFVRVEAGYLDAGAPSVRTIFFGNIQYVLPRREGGDIIWEMVAASNPIALLNAFVPLQRTNATYGELIQDLLRGIGISLNNADPFLFGLNEDGEPDEFIKSIVTKLEYTATGPVVQEIDNLRKELNDVAQREFIGFPSNTDPFQFDFVDLTNSTGQEFLEINLDGPNVFSAGPIALSGASETPQLIEARDCRLLDQLTVMNIVEEFEVSSAFDPRVHIAMGIKFTGSVEGSGTFVVNRVSHSLGGQEWTTDYGGPFGGGDFLGYSRAESFSGTPAAADYQEEV